MFKHRLFYTTIFLMCLSFLLESVNAHLGDDEYIVKFDCRDVYKIPGPDAIRSGYVWNQGPRHEVLPFELGPKGSLQFWFRTEEQQIPSAAVRPRKTPLVKIGDTVSVSFFHQGNAINLFIEWDEGVDTAIDRHIRVLMPEFPGRSWHHFALHWDEESGLINAFLDGSPFYWEDQRVSAWKNPVSDTMTLYSDGFALADVRVANRPLDPERLREVLGPEFLGRLDHLLGAKPLGALDVESRKGELLYHNDLANPDAVAQWVLEGPGVVDHLGDGWLLMSSERPEGPDGHVVYWAPDDFPESFIAEWDFQILSEDGLCIVFFSAKGSGGEDLFDPSLQQREGLFGQYVRGDIDNYHISYFANTPLNPRRTTNLRKNPGLFLLASGPVGVVPGSQDVHRVTVVKDRNHIQLAVDGNVIVDFIDDGERFGPVLGSGKIGLRQMQWTRARYRNFQVSSIFE
jgi:hypothetical protein